MSALPKPGSAEERAEFESESANLAKMFDAVMAAPVANEPRPAKSRYLSAGDWCAKHPPPEWLIDEFLPTGVGMLLGAPGAGKSFFALDLAMHVLLGKKWQTRDVKQGAVVWVAAEAQGSVEGRLAAACQAHGITAAQAGAQGLYITGLMDLADAGEMEVNLADLPEARLIVIDTLSAASPTLDENSKEMQKAINAAQRFAKKTGGTVLLIHHVGKDVTKGARGWSGLTGAADFVLAVERPDESSVYTPRVCTVRKQRDAEDGRQVGFQLVKQHIGTKANGTPRFSLSVDACSVPVKDTGTPIQLLAMTELQNTPAPWTEADLNAAVKAVKMHRNSRGKVKQWLVNNLKHLPDGTYEPKERALTAPEPETPKPIKPRKSTNDRLKDEFINSAETRSLDHGQDGSAD